MRPRRRVEWLYIFLRSRMIIWIFCCEKRIFRTVSADETYRRFNAVLSERFFLSFFLSFLRVFPTNTAPSSSSCRPSSFSPSQWVQPAPNTTGPLVMFGAAFDSRLHNHAVIIIELLVPPLRKGRVKEGRNQKEREKQNKTKQMPF